VTLHVKQYLKTTACLLNQYDIPNDELMWKVGEMLHRGIWYQTKKLLRISCSRYSWKEFGVLNSHLRSASCIPEMNFCITYEDDNDSSCWSASRWYCTCRIGDLNISWFGRCHLGTSDDMENKAKSTITWTLLTLTWCWC